MRELVNVHNKTLTRADLADAISSQVGVSREEAVDLVESFLGEISSALIQGDQVKLSSFGSFGLRDKAERIGRNPKTGEQVPITSRRVLYFRPSNIVKDRINASLTRPQAAE